MMIKKGLDAKERLRGDVGALNLGPSRVPLSSLLYAHIVSFESALASTLGKGHIILLNNYASKLSQLIQSLMLEIVDLESFIKYLKEEGIVEGCDTISRNPNEIEFVVRGCKFSKIFHKELGLHGYFGGICTIAMIALIFLARRKGWKPGENIYNYVKFSGELTCYLKDGSITRFRI